MSANRIFVLCVSLFVGICTFFWGSQTSSASPPQVFSRDELSKHGADASAVYVSILGSVYDVSNGRKHYGEGGGYSFFAGIDGSRAFVTGDFSEAGLTDDIAGLSPTEVLGIFEWKEGTYDAKYTKVGVLHGVFYDEDGTTTLRYHEAIAARNAGMNIRAQAAAENELWPPCNSKWAQGRGGEVWCSDPSHFPRERYTPGSSAQPRCVCADASSIDDPRLQVRAGCSPNSHKCTFS